MHAVKRQPRQGCSGGGSHGEINDHRTFRIGKCLQVTRDNHAVNRLAGMNGVDGRNQFQVRIGGDGTTHGCAHSTTRTDNTDTNFSRKRHDPDRSRSGSER